MNKIILFILFLFAIACKKKDCEPCNDTNRKDTPNTIIGQWLRYDTLTREVVELSFYSNYSYTASTKGNIPDTKGSYSIKDLRIFIQDNTCDSIPGIYDVEFPSPNKLRFIVYSDTCKYVRKEVMTGSDWIRE